MDTDRPKQEDTTRDPLSQQPADATGRTGDDRPREIGGPKGPDPTRYGDWERRGRCIDF